jgi:hypothetical protein
VLLRECLHLTIQGGSPADRPSFERPVPGAEQD